MNTANQQVVSRRGRAVLVSAAFGAALTIAACMGNIGTGGTGTSATSGTGGQSNGNNGGNGGVSGATTSTGLPPPPPTATAPGAAAPPLDPGTVAAHRLNAFEYDNTVNDLLGLQQKTAETNFVADEVGGNGFDNEADVLTMTDAEFTQYFNAADALGEQVFATPALVSRILTCTPSSATDATCLNTFINSFGPLAYRRPLFADEVTRFQKLAADAVTNGADFNGSIKQIVKMVLSSVPFLYRMEFDANPASTVAHAVSPYELASRLSYLLWSSMPDTALFADAASGALTTDATLTAEFSRMIASPKAQNFVQSFAGQWLGTGLVTSDLVTASAFPKWTTALGQAYAQEELLYFNEFLNGDYTWDKFLTAPVNFVNGVSAPIYAANSPTAAAATKGVPTTQTTFTKVLNMDPNRIGFMGLGGFLRETSFSYRTSPTLRGKFVLLSVLGEVVPQPPPGIPALDPASATTDATTFEENVRAILLAHRTLGAACNTCHERLDPIGLGMENFDGIGMYRATYGNGDAIDSSGQLPDGTMFTSVQQLATLLSSGTRLTEMLNFASQQLMTYALSRPLNTDPTAGATDTPYLTQIQTSWATQQYALKSLIQDVIINQTFRERHGGV
jgi:Protein of unknown function (DUF1592)/Protein of unknown function (DUF1588)/Protein of unknown function (DUF1587)/Protein of unknown function (DUF1595)/Protein of unknown function (DUF1585)